eukprot:TRINITY_DN37088_c0_g1_i1.p1 TRINITY_DN37088_c0_g1~~TRINITY_DN37088_c0_g1_i1.p1  ORF type:complete len:471 (-),score=66.26 TRINITY_DN37088_c0_g1_i1:58-1470(-)
MSCVVQSLPGIVGRTEKQSGLSIWKPTKARILPSIVKGGPSSPRGEPVATVYHWSPVQVKQHDQSRIAGPEVAFAEKQLGTYVNTLSMDVTGIVFQDATPYSIRPASGAFRVKEHLWAYQVGDGFVVCKGVVEGVCPRCHDLDNGRDIRIGRLPENLRPRRPLTFAALSREVQETAGVRSYNSQLVTIVVTVEGWITGISSREREGAIDLSSIRFSLGTGIVLIDQVRLFTCDVAGTRLVTMQGALAAGRFGERCRKALAMLPESCRPRKELHFVVAGGAAGGFNLLSVKPLHSHGIGGKLWLVDSVWEKDEISLTGMMWETSENALGFSTMTKHWSPEMEGVFVREFQTFLMKKFGSVEKAWQEAFDVDGSGEITFTEFGLGCKAIGYVGNATHLWAAFDSDNSGEISYDELSMGIGEPLKTVSNAPLVKLAGGVPRPPMGLRALREAREKMHSMPTSGTLLPSLATPR